MGTEITFRRGSNFPTSGSGITLSEPVFETTLHTFHIGLGHGVTAEWVGAPISGLSADIAAGITYKTPTASAVKNYIAGLCFGNTGGGGTSITQYVSSFNGLTGAVQGVSAAVAGTGISVSGATGAVTITNTGVQSFNGNTGAVTGASLGANTFTGLNSFNAGISSFGGTFSGNIVQFLSGLSASLVRIGSLESNGSNPVTFADNKFKFTVLGFPSSFYTTLQADPTTSADRTITLPDASGTVALTSQLMGAVNGSTAATTAVTSFNGLTGAVTGASLGANTFTALNTFNSGISANSLYVTNGITFGGSISFTDPLYFNLNSDTFSLLNLGGSNIQMGWTAGANINISNDGESAVRIYGDTVTTTGILSGVTANFTGLVSSTVGFSGSGANIKGIVTSFNGLSGAIQGVSAAVAGTGISVSGATGSVTITNIGVQSFNGNTGAVTGASLGANTFTGLNSFNAGISASGGTFSGFTRFIGGLSAAGITCPSIVSRGTSLTLLGATSGGIASGSQIILPTDSALQLNGYGGAVSIGAYGLQTYVSSLKFNTSDDLNEIYGSFTLRPQSYINGDLTLYFPGENGTVAITSQLMGAVNGSTAATTAVTSFNGRTGAVQGVSAAVAGTGISVSGATGAVTITNIGVQSFNGLTGAVTGVTVGGANTFTALNSFNAGISSAGGTFGATAAFNSSIVLQNSEFIRNTTNGRMDFMPAPAGTTHYGMYLDFTSWGFGPSIGTIRSSDDATNTTGIKWDAQLVLGNNVRFNFGSNSQNGVVLSDTGNDTIQVFTDTTTGTNSGSLALVSSAGINHANRSPGTTHTNPNLYVYRGGTASANDFIRIEHDGTNANIVTGGSSAIDMEPGSGFVGFSGGISASGGITFSSTMRVAGTATFAGLINSTAGLSGTGITLSGNLSAATKSFVIPHPTKPQMTLQHGSLEGPENGVYVRGRLRGNDTITLPEYWRGLVHEDSITANLTEIGDRNHHWVAYMGDYTITVASERGSVDCFYTVWGERKDVGKLPVEY